MYVYAANEIINRVLRKHSRKTCINQSTNQYYSTGSQVMPHTMFKLMLSFNYETIPDSTIGTKVDRDTVICTTIPINFLFWLAKGVPNPPFAFSGALVEHKLHWANVIVTLQAPQHRRVGTKVEADESQLANDFAICSALFVCTQPSDIQSWGQPEWLEWKGKRHCSHLKF